MARHQEMITDKWLTAIGGMTQTAFWAIGYFFGFTLVTGLSFGTLFAGSFDEIGRVHRRFGQVIYRRQGKYYLVAEFVAVIGWLFLGCLNSWWFWRHWPGL